MKIDKDVLDTLIKLWLNDKEISIYLSWLEIWNATIQDLATKSKIKRVTIYSYITSLKAKWFFSEIKKWNRRFFIAEHPKMLFLSIKKRKSEILNIQNELGSIEDNLSSVVSTLEDLYKPSWTVVKPSVRFYEWIEGIRTVLNDSLSSKEEIYTYSNVDWIFKYIQGISAEYLEKRKENSILKKWLVIDTKNSRKILKDYDNKVTKIRFLKSVIFNLEMEIYDWKVSYITFTNNKPVWVIIENKEIYEMHRSLFELNWANSSD